MNDSFSRMTFSERVVAKYLQSFYRFLVFNSKIYYEQNGLEYRGRKNDETFG